MTDENIIPVSASDNAAEADCTATDTSAECIADTAVSTDSDISGNNDAVTIEDKPEAPPKPPFSSKLPPWLAKIMRPMDDMNHMWYAMLLPILVMVLVYTAMKVWPFGDNSVLVLDLNGQYVYYFEAIRDFFRGEQGILYSFERALGGEFLGIVAYYLASPFSFIVALFPEGMITESLYLILLLKTGLAGLNMCVYLHKSHPTKPVHEVLFSVMYALTSYGVVMQHNTMWFDCVLFLPLILLGVESLIKEGKYKLFTITLALSVLSNYYIGYMVCIAVAVYFFFYYFMCTENERNPGKIRYHFVKSLAKIAIFSIIALGIACAMVIPAYYSLQFGKTEFSNPDFAFSQKFDFLDLISKMFPASYDTVRPEGWPFVYSGLITLIFLPIFFMSEKITTRKKVAYGIISAFFIFSFCTTTIDLVWHGFQRPNWLNYRYSFIFCFIMIVMAYLAFEQILHVKVKTFFGIGIMLGLIVVFLQKMEYSNIRDMTTVWITLGFIFLYMIILSRCLKLQMKGQIASILCVVVLLELFGNALCDVVALDDDVVYSSRKGYKEFQDKWTPIADWVNESDKGFYRTEKTTHRKTNDNFLLNLNGLSNSTSTLNQKQIEFLNRMGYSSKSHWSKYLGGTPVADSLLGVKYLLAQNYDDVNQLWGKPIRVDSKNGTMAYRNQYALSVGYMVSNDLVNFDMAADRSPFTRMNSMVTRMLGEKETVELFVPYTHTESGSNVKEYYFNKEQHQHYSKVDVQREASVTFTVDELTNNYEIFAYFPSEWPRDTKLKVNGADTSEFFTNETFRIVSLGRHEAGEELEVTMTITGEEVYLYREAEETVTPYFFYLDEELFKEVMPKLSEGNLRIGNHTDSTLSGTVNVTEDKTQLLLTIPYDEGWKVYVDGEETETYEILDSLTAVTLTPGNHTLEIKYRPWAVYAGATIAGVSVIILAGIITVEYIIKKKKSSKEQNSLNEKNNV